MDGNGWYWRALQGAMDRYGHLFKSDDHKKAMDAITAEMLD